MSVFEQTAKINRFVAPIVGVVGAAAWFHPAVAGSDLWWHLAAGRDILALGHVPTTDIYSYTFGGERWLNPEWLWAVLYWIAYDVHPQAAAWLNFSVVSAVFALAFVAARRISGSLLGAGIAVWMAAASAHWFIDIRPHLFTLLFLGVFLLTRNRPWAPWFWPALVVVWVNTHGGFVFGIGAIGLHVLVLTVQKSIAEQRLVIPLRAWIGVALCFVAMLLNPYGYSILEYPYDYLDADSPFRSIIEWKAPASVFNPDHWDLVFNLEMFHGRFWLVALFAVLGLPLAAKRDPYHVLLCAVTFTMAYTSRRFIPLFAVTATPLVASAIGFAVRELGRGAPWLKKPELGLSTTVIAALLAALLWQNVRIYPMFLQRWTEWNLYPEAALRYLVALAPSERILNYYNWGGYIMLHAPRFKLFIDGRANTVYDDAIYLDYLSLLSGAPGFHARVARYPAAAALLPRGSAPARLLAEPPSNWEIVYSDQVAAVLLPPDSPVLQRPIPNPRQVLGDHQEILLYDARNAIRRGEFNLAEKLARSAIEKNPLLVRAYGELAWVYAHRGDLEGVARVFAEGIRAHPRRIKRLRQREAGIYEAKRELKRAIETYEQAVPGGPFSRPQGVLLRIERLRQEYLEATAYDGLEDE